MGSGKLVACSPLAWDGPPGGVGRAVRNGRRGCSATGEQRVRLRDGVAQGLLWVDLVEQRVLDGVEDDVVYLGLVRDRRDDVGVLRDGVLGDRSRTVLDRGRRGREERIAVCRRVRRIDGDLLR